MVRPDSHHQLHFILIPFLAQGHMIPMFDIATLIAERHVLVTVITTTFNASRFKAKVNHARASGLPIQLAELPFPTQEVGLPDGFENLDVLHCGEQAVSFFNAVDLLQKPIEEYLEEQQPSPSCIISDSLLPWTCQTAEKFDIPRIVFHGMCCFSLLSWFNLRCFNSHESVTSDSELFPIPGLKHQIEIAKSQLPPGVVKSNPEFDAKFDSFKAADLKSYGVVVNSFSELENEYVGYYGKALGNKKVWTIGPVSLCNKDMLVKAARGNRAAISEHECLKWLDLRKPKSVVYVSFGSLCRLGPSQLMQIGLALEASKKPFIWVIRGVVEPEEIDKWLAEGFGDRTKETGFIIRGWAPQILILSHPAIGGFLTHCGWNSTMESICAGVPMITWPLFGEQFLNEKLVVNVLKIGVDLGILRRAMRWNPVEKLDVLVTMEEISKAVERLMDEGEEGEERRKRASTFGEKARMALGEGGSSSVNMTVLIEDILEHANKNWPTELHKSSTKV